MKTVAAFLATLLLATCWLGEVDDFGFGPLSGEWTGTFDYAGDPYNWRVSITQDNYSEPGGPFDGVQVLFTDSGELRAKMTGTYYHPDVSMDFEIDLPPSPLVCGFRGEASGEINSKFVRMDGHLSCLQADTRVVNQAIALRKLR